MAPPGIGAELPNAKCSSHPLRLRRTLPGSLQARQDDWHYCMAQNCGGAEKQCATGESATGFLLIAPDFQPIYANAEAVRILAYPEAPEPLDLSDRCIACKIRSTLLVNDDGQSKFATEFISGRRHYRCRAFSLNNDNVPDHPAIAVILERSRTSFDAAQAAAQFHLTARERETLRYLMEGLTNKEIGYRMNISPNTVKAFLKLIMMKMNVSTRSGIVGKAVNPVLKPRLLTAAANHPFGE